MTRNRFTLTACALAAVVLAACNDATVAPADQSQALVPAIGATPRGAADDIVPGEIIVQAREGADVETVGRAHGLALGQLGYARGFAVLKVPAGSERARVTELARDASVLYAEPNFLRQPTSINAKLWAFYNDGTLRMKFSSGASKGLAVNSKVPVADADEDNVEGYAAGGADVVVGSLDTGVDFTHPEFPAGRLIKGRDWVNNDADPADDNGHGTHTTGTMAGTTVGVAGVSGAAPHVKVYVQKVCGRRGCPTSAIVSAIRAAADYPGMVAMNLSLGGSSESQSEKDAIAYATGKNVLVIASAGNDGSTTVACPACDPNAISVAATNWQDVLSYYSQSGPGLDISAPGGECYSNTTEDGCIYSAYKGGVYKFLQGTSMAAPQVTGTAGIVASKTGLRGAALRSRILGTTDDLGASGYDETFGSGRLNSYRAVTNGSLGAGL